MFERHVEKWRLEPDGEPRTTAASHLLPVRFRGHAAILKIAQSEEERRGAGVMAWWDGNGAARVFAHDGEALLLERATGSQSLVDMAREGNDDDATAIICDVVSKLHNRSGAPRGLVPLSRWFEDLPAAAGRTGEPMLATCAQIAQQLLASEECVVLHGDIHHGNILDFGARGWLAIDPKGLVGERTFDYANLFSNPDLGFAASPERFGQRLGVVVRLAQVPRERLIRWIMAWAGLSAVWRVADGVDRDLNLSLAKLAAAELDRALSRGH